MIDPQTEECSNVTLGATVQILEGTNLQNTTANNALECCEACQGEFGCTSWIHNRENGIYALYNMTRATVTMSSGSELDVGGFTIADDIAPTTEVPSRANPFFSVSAGPSQSSGSFVPFGGVVGSVGSFSSFGGSSSAALSVTSVPVPYCRVRKGVTYPNGNVLVVGSTPSSTFCCNLCRLSRNCNSWFSIAEMVDVP